jgi:hypothetical protein
MPSACSGELWLRVPTSRFSQPTRLLEPGSASSSSSIAEKCDRLGAGSPVAWTAAILPAFHSGSRGASLGCSPKNESAARSCAFGIAIRGRAV